MEIRAMDVAATLILNIIHCAYASDHILSCNVTDIETCPGKNQVCKGATSQCECLEGYSWVGDECQLPAPGGSSWGHGAAVAALTILTLVLILAGLALITIKYNLVDYVRHRLNMRRNNDVMYEDVMIGHDDPPLSP